MWWNVDTGTRSGTLFACKITVFEVQEPRSSIVRFQVSTLSVKICTDATHRRISRNSPPAGPVAGPLDHSRYRSAGRRPRILGDTQPGSRFTPCGPAGSVGPRLAQIQGHRR